LTDSLSSLKKKALFQRLGLNLPSQSATELPSINPESPQVLIWSGSTSVGQWAIQLARAAGYHVITTASPKNHAILEKMGAAEVYDYRDESIPEKISKEHPRLNAALDCISENGTQSLVAKSLGSKGGKVVVLLKPESEAINLRNDVEIIHTLAYTCLGHPFAYGRAEFKEEQVHTDRDFIVKFANGNQGIFYHLLKNKLITGNRIKVFGQGNLDGILEGLEQLEKGQVSGEKLAYKL
jgi:NADPH:quinone reductase-like Zn-dependent oxidoreductase